MGHSSLPMLNKSGTFIRWTNVWDDKHFFHIKFEEDIFLKLFFELILKEQILRNKFVYLTKYFVYLKNFYLKNFYLKIKKFRRLRLSLINTFANTFLVLYFMRFYILKFQSYYMVLINLFLPLTKKKREQNKQRNNLKLLFFKIFLHLTKIKYCQYSAKQVFLVENF